MPRPKLSLKARRRQELLEAPPLDFVVAVLTEAAAHADEPAPPRAPRSDGPRTRAVTPPEEAEEDEDEDEAEAPAPAPRAAVAARAAYAAGRRPGDAPPETFCFCGGMGEGRMVGCDNPNCRTGGGWFHYECMGLEAEPTGAWYCPDCAETMRSAPKRYKADSVDEPAAPPADASDEDEYVDGGARSRAAAKRKRAGAEPPAGASARFFGVSYNSRASNWRAHYKDAEARQVTIGYFSEEEDAALEYNAVVRAAGLGARRKLNPVKDGRLVEKDKMYSKFYGVTWVRRVGKWTARIQIPNRKKAHLGYFVVEHDAARAVDKYLYENAPLELAQQKANFPLE